MWSFGRIGQRTLSHDHQSQRRARSTTNGLSAHRPLRLEPLERRLLLVCPALPITQSVRSKNVQFDQCYSQTFSEAGTNYEVQVFYTETNSATNQAQCTAMEGAGRCEHAIADADDAMGNNLVAVAMAAEAQTAFRFYIRRNLFPLPAGQTVMQVYIAEDPRSGGITGNTFYVDDERVDNNDTIQKRILAFHEMHHLVQILYDGSWNDFYGEGAARTIEDRVDTSVDADTGHWFIPQVNGILSSDGDRSSDLSTLDYETVLWWTWLMDQYRVGAGVDPPVSGGNDVGWNAMRDFYLELQSQPGDELGALSDFISDQGSTFREDFIDYTLALYAFKYNSTDPRLGFIDAEINAQAGLSGHTVINTSAPFAEVATNINPRSSRYWEFTPANTCDFTAFTFDGNGSPYGFSVMTVDGGNLQDRWTSYSNTWARTVRTSDLDRIVGVVSAFDQSGMVDVGRGCVEPTIDIKSPSSASFVTVGTSNSPRTFIVRLDVDGKDGSAVAGLTTSVFDVTLRKAGGGPDIPASVVNSVYVLDDYWLLVQAPGSGDGVETGEYYDLTVTLGTTITDTESSAVLYTEQAQDVMIILDRSGSMGGGSGKLEAAQAGANLLVNQLSSSDQAGYVRFDTNAQLRESLDQVDTGHRIDLTTAILAETPGASTSIGDGLSRALTEHAANRDPDHPCSFVLLSDGHENAPQFWADVKDDVIERGCAVHTISLGPEANESLMQEIAESVTGGSHDYATTSGTVPVASFLDWKNNFGRIWDDIGTDISKRQRINTAATGIQSGRIDFEDLPVDSGFPNGVPFSVGGVHAFIGPFFPLAGPPLTGFARVEDDFRSGGSGHDFALINSTVHFDFNRTLDELSLQFNEFGGSHVNLWINDTLVPAADLQQLDGSTINGVDITVGLAGEFGHLLKLDGDITQFAIGGHDLVIDNVQFDSRSIAHAYVVDPFADQLVLTVGWQNDSNSRQQTTLIDPFGNIVSTAFRRRSSAGTNEVWTVPTPIQGPYRLIVNNLNQEYFVTGTVRSRLEMHTFIGGNTKSQGVEVPLIASLSIPVTPLRGAVVRATVKAPGLSPRTVELFDDGNHGDGLPHDGVYGNVYTRTANRERTEVNPREGEEPRSVGSYAVKFEAFGLGYRREAEDSFVISEGEDRDGDDIPDIWELTHGLDPTNPNDASSDTDMDGLPAVCEFRVGLDPRNSDTDGGGERDGSEVRIPQSGACTPRTERRDPHDAANDLAGPLSGLIATAEADLINGPYVMLEIGRPLVGALESAQIKRRTFDSEGQMIENWRVVHPNFESFTYLDDQVIPGFSYDYMVIPELLSPNDVRVGGRVEQSNLVRVLTDPYAPGGSILINDGGLMTRSPVVTLNLSADDEFRDHDGGPLPPPIPHSNPSQLMMRISNEPTFAGVSFGPYRTRINGWNLGDISSGTVATVYVQYRDLAENVSETFSDSIIVSPQPGDTFPFNGCVDIDDLNNVRNHFGRNGERGLPGDAVGELDGMVNIDDLNAIRNHFGEGICSPGIGSNISTHTMVPDRSPTDVARAADWVFALPLELWNATPDHLTAQSRARHRLAAESGDQVGLSSAHTPRAPSVRFADSDAALLPPRAERTNLPRRFRELEKAWSSQDPGHRVDAETLLDIVAGGVRWNSE